MLFRNDKKDPREQSPSDAGQRVPLLPLRDIIVFPHMVVPLFVGRQKSIRALEEAMNKQKFILLAAQKDAKTNDPGEEDIYRVGTLGTVVQLLRLPDGTVKVLDFGLAKALELGLDELEVVSDSELMVKQMTWQYRVKNEALRELSLEAGRLARRLGSVEYTSVRREHNKLADQLVNEALDGQ